MYDERRRNNNPLQLGVYWRPAVVVDLLSMRTGDGTALTVHDETATVK